MPTPVVIVTSGGRPVTNVTSGEPMTPVSSGGEPVTLVDNGEPVALVNDDLSEWATLTALAQILALEPVALWWPSEATMTVARDGTGAAPATGEPVGRMLDLTPNAVNAIAPTDAARPLLAADPSRLTWDKVDDVLNATMPATTGKMVLSTPEGTAVYGVNISAGSYDVGGRAGDYFPGTSLVGQTVGDFTDEEAASIATIFRAAGGGSDYGAVTDFNNFWRGWTELTSFPLLDTSSGTNFQFAWLNCNSLTTFPLLDVSSGTNFYAAWHSCSSLTTFPLLNVSSGTNFSYAWLNCNSLTTFPLLDVSSGTNFSYAWQNCTSLTTFPLLDVSSGTNFYAAWQNCSSLTTFPLLNVSSGTNFQFTWYNCNSLTTFPLLNVSSGTNFQETWRNCTGLTTFPLLDVSSGTTFYLAWAGCTSLTTFPLLDVSSGTNFQSAWQSCSSLTTFPANMFDTVTATNFTNAFLNTALSQTSIDNILTSINTAGTSSGTFTQSGGSAPSTTGEAAIDALRGRGWTVTVTGGY